MRCSECGQTIPENSLFCNICGERQKETISQFNWNTSYGIWEVTTEGDCEGKSIKNLGIYEGHIDEIAFGLADKVGYSLRFSPVKINKEIIYKPKKRSVHIQLDIDSNTWNKSVGERIEFFQKLFKERFVNFNIRDGSYYGSVLLEKKII